MLYDQIKLLSEDDTEEVQKILKQRDELEDRFYELPTPQSEELNELFEQIRAENEQENKKLQSLLEEFYTNRNIPADSRLHITDGPMGQGRLEPVATEVQEQETDAQKTAERLKEFQSEMHEFTEFLKKRFYELKG